jgi:hypothetical protein
MKHTLGFLIAICAVIGLASPAPAAVILSIAPPTVDANRGDTGDTFDVLLSNTGASALSIAAFQFEVSIADPNVVFTLVDDSPAAASYIFAGNSLFGPDINLNGPGQTIDASDNTADGSNASVGAGQTVGLGRVIFNVSPTAAFGSFAVSRNRGK